VADWAWKRAGTRPPAGPAIGVEGACAVDEEEGLAVVEEVESVVLLVVPAPAVERCWPPQLASTMVANTVTSPFTAALNVAVLITV
jgi:hypothetical protein